MLNLTKNNVLIASNDYILNNVLYFIKGKKYKIERRLTHWEAYVITSEKKDIHKNNVDVVLSETEIKNIFNYFLYERKEKLKKICLK